MTIWLIEFDFPGGGGMYDSLRFVSAHTLKEALAVVDRDTVDGYRILQTTNLNEAAKKKGYGTCFLERDYIE